MHIFKKIKMPDRFYARQNELCGFVVFLERSVP